MNDTNTVQSNAHNYLSLSACSVHQNMCRNNKTPEISVKKILHINEKIMTETLMILQKKYSGEKQIHNAPYWDKREHLQLHIFDVLYATT